MNITMAHLFHLRKVNVYKAGKTARTYNVPAFIDILYEGSDSPVARTKN
jgi:hypothetical protein